ncbi:MAG TPA: hypothetical protein VMX13_00805 [Sedimentisphaerales bacterium]|nr:hypothetical protein [Sedimentisphaerales bacterium]
MAIRNNKSDDSSYPAVNDTDNSAGLGVGENMHYVESARGKLVDAEGIKGGMFGCIVATAIKAIRMPQRRICGNRDYII